MSEINLILVIKTKDVKKLKDAMSLYEGYLNTNINQPNAIEHMEFTREILEELNKINL